MNASIFLASFLGCLFALGFVAIATWGIIKWRTRRFLAANAQDMARRIKAEMSPDEMREMQKFASEFVPGHAAGPRDVAGSEPTAKVP